VRILFLTHRLPYAPDRGDRIRAYFLLREMSRFASVFLFSLVHDDSEAAQVSRVPFATEVRVARVPRLRNLVRGLAQLGTRRPLTHVLLDAPDAREALASLKESARPDLVVAYCSGMAQFAIESSMSSLPFVLDMVDLDSTKWDQLAGRHRGLWRWIYAREARTLRAFETAAVNQARTTLVVNDRERAEVMRLDSRAKVVVVENGIDVASFSPSASPVADPVVVFCGVMSYLPNEEGVRWFVADVWPRVRARRPDARFMIVGGEPTRAIQSLAADSSIEVTGRVPAVQPFLSRAAVSVAPLRLARGLQNKVLEALAAGVPVVVTSAVGDGLPIQVRRSCETADDADAFAAAVLQLLNLSPGERRDRARAAHVETLGWSEQMGALEDILRGAMEQA
jgi:sugar transferase (PEP-CTERM/EpsH1 system associated)